MSARKGILIASVLVIAVLIFLFYRFDYLRNRRQILELKQQYQVVEIDLQKARRVAASLKEVEAKQKELERQLEAAKQMLPTEKDVPSLLRMATDVGLRSGIRFSLFKPGALSSKQFYSELPIEIGVEGGYHDLGRFLTALGDLPRIVRVSDISIDGTGDVNRTIKCELKASTFVLESKK